MALNTTFGGVNPLVKEEPVPEWYKLSHPISQPEGDKTMGTILKGAGDFLKGGVDATTDIIKKHLSDEIYRRVDVEREGFTDFLRDVAPGGGGIRKARGSGGTVVPAGEEDGGEALSYAPTSVPGRDDPFTAMARAPGGDDKDAVITEEGAKVPDDVRARLRYAEGLKNALATGNIPPTFYVGNLNDVAKSLRAQHPGFRDYIDQEMSRITGMNPANALVSNLLRDINSFAGGADDKQKTKAINEVFKFMNEGGDELLPKGPAGEQLHPTSAQMIKNINDGKVDLAGVAAWIAMGRRNQGLVRDADQRRQLGSHNIDIARQNTLSGVNVDGNVFANQYFNTAFVGQGFNIHSVQDVQSAIDRYRSGQPVLDDQGRPVTGVWWQQQAAGMNTMIDRIRRDLRSKYLYTPGPDGIIPVNKLGDGGTALINKQIEDTLAPFVEAHKAIMDKDIGVAYRTFQYSEAVLRDARAAAILTKHPLSAYVVAIQTAKSLGMDEIANDMSKGYLLNLKKEGLPLTVPSWLNTIGYEALLNHVPRPDTSGAPAPGVIPAPATAPAPAIPGAPAPPDLPRSRTLGPRAGAEPTKMTIDKAFEEAIAATNKDPAFADPGVYSSLTGVVKYITDPKNKDEGRRGLLTYAFGNNGDTRFLGKLSVDRYEKGVFHPGRFDTFEQFTSKPLVAEAKRLHGDKWNFNNLVKWTEENFSTPLMGNALRTLEEVKSPHITFDWDPATRTLSPVIKPEIAAMLKPAPFAEVGEGPARVTGYSARVIRQAVQRDLANIQPTIDNLNKAFRGLGNVYDEANLGDSYEKRVVAILAANNIRGSINGTEYQVMKAMIDKTEPPVIKPPEKPFEATPRAPGKESRLVPYDVAPTADIEYNTRRILDSMPRAGYRRTTNLVQPGEELRDITVE